MASNRDFLKRFLSKEKRDNYGQKKETGSLVVKSDAANCTLCNEKLDFRYKNCLNCKGPVNNITAKKLKKLWNVKCSHQLYRRKGDWYHVLDYFPGALFDSKGFVIFETEKEFNECPHLSMNRETSNGKGQVNVIGNHPQNIRKIKGYKYMFFKNGEWILK